MTVFLIPLLPPVTYLPDPYDPKDPNDPYR